ICPGLLSMLVACTAPCGRECSRSIGWRLAVRPSRAKLRYHGRVKALNQPESWWGWHGYNHPEALSITQILQAKTMPVRVAAILSLAMERGAPMILAAEPPGAGKTTILTALLAFAPPDSSVYFTRGWGETFAL